MISLILDSGPLGMLAHPRASLEITQRVKQLLDAGIRIVIPEIADYEVRRSLILENLTPSLERLDAMEKAFDYFPLTTEAMRKAAGLWAEARKRHQPSASKDALDGDVILAAQAILAEAIVVTNNVDHLSSFVRAIRWQDTDPSNLVF